MPRYSYSVYAATLPVNACSGVGSGEGSGEELPRDAIERVRAARAREPRGIRRPGSGAAARAGETRRPRETHGGAGGHAAAHLGNGRAVLFVQDLHELLHVDGLQQVQVESSLARALPIHFLAPAGDRHDAEGTLLLQGPQALRDLIAIEPGQADVEENDVGPELRRRLKRDVAIVDDAGLVPQ